MAVAVERMRYEPIHPAHAVLLAGTFPLFLGVLLSDLAYAGTYEVQWKNFASWLIVGGLVLAGMAGLWALARLRHKEWRGGRTFLHIFLLMAAWGLAFLNALIHAKDAWASMPASVTLSIVVLALVTGAIGTGFSATREPEPR